MSVLLAKNQNVLSCQGLIVILASTGLTSIDDLKGLLNIAVFASNAFGKSSDYYFEIVIFASYSYFHRP